MKRFRSRRSRRLRAEGASSMRAARRRSAIDVHDLGTNSRRVRPTTPTTRIRSPKQVSTGEAKRGVLLCGTGLGMSYAANRHPHVRAAVAWTPEIAKLARKHNDANVLVLPARFVTDDQARRNPRRPGSRHQVRRRAPRAPRREDRIARPLTSQQLRLKERMTQTRSADQPVRRPVPGAARSAIPRSPR